MLKLDFDIKFGRFVGNFWESLSCSCAGKHTDLFNRNVLFVWFSGGINNMSDEMYVGFYLDLWIKYN